MSVERKKYCVYGEWRESKTDKWMPVTDSSTGEVIAEVPCCTVEEVDEPFLIKEGFLKRTPRGREVTELAYKHLGRNIYESNGGGMNNLFE